MTLRLFGVRLEGGGYIVDPADELRGTFALQAREGAMMKTDKDMLDGILDLSDVDVSEIMVHRKSMLLIDAERPTSNVVQEMLASPYTRVPLWRWLGRPSPVHTKHIPFQSRR